MLGYRTRGKRKTREQKELSKQKQKERERERTLAGLGDTHSFVLEILLTVF